MHASILITLLTAASAVSCPKYDRDAQYGDWIDADQDCQKTRAEILIRESRVAVTFLNGKTCTVDSGLWMDPYTGDSLRAASDLDIDHMVPVSEAHKSGAWKWTQERRREFYNFMDSAYHLIPITDDVNSAKQDFDPARWLPPLVSYHRQYALNWMRIKVRWGLKSDKAELDSLRSLLGNSDAVFPQEAPVDICTELPVSLGVAREGADAVHRTPEFLQRSKPWGFQANGRFSPWKTEALPK